MRRMPGMSETSLRSANVIFAKQHIHRIVQCYDINIKSSLCILLQLTRRKDASLLRFGITF
jgi:hypothetical protein